MIYGLEYVKAIEALNKGFNYSSFAVSELLEMLEILAKIYSDIYEFKFLGVSSNDSKR